MPPNSGTDAALRSLTHRSDAKGLAQLAGHAALLTITALAISASRDSAWLVPAMLVHGIALVFLFAALHESIHRTAFANRRLNDVVAWICGALLVLPPAYFRSYHMAHHRHTQQPGLDPELAAPKPASLGAYLWYLSGLPYWAERFSTTLRLARGRVTEPFIPDHLRPAIVGEARSLLGLYALIALASVALQSSTAIWYWIVPALLGQPVLRLFLLAEHAGCPRVPEMLQNSRTTLSLWPLRRLAWNMPYHAEHHAYPALPFHALPKAHALLADAIVCQATGYLPVHREILNRLLKTRVIETVDSRMR
jgi:fatty acid desaturase